MSPITSEIEDTLQNLPKDVRDEYIMAFKNKRNNQNRNNYEGNNVGHGNYNHNTSNNRQADKNQGKKNKSSASYDAFTCWFCNKKVIPKFTADQG